MEEETDNEAASERGRRVKQLLVDAGRHAGLEPKSEFPVVGGRVDLVWTWKGVPPFMVDLPLVGFEIESSWRTRKHVKGDFLNLLELQPSLGVIVLLGDGGDVESLRRFSKDLIARHPGRFEIWTEKEVLELGDPKLADQLTALPPAPSDPPRGTRAKETLEGKYGLLTAWLARQETDRITATFDQVEGILGFPLPPSASNHPAYWSGGQPGGTTGNAIRAAGWRARNVDLQNRRLTLVRE